MKYVWYGLGWIAIGAAALFILGPGLVGAFDLSCWFLFDGQCTRIDWTENRKLWAIAPWALAFFIGFFGLVGI
jgi:hypothetical protein